jgi:hypothetical protein
MPPIRHPCRRRIQLFSPPQPPELHACIAGDLSRWQRRCSALGEACVRRQIRAGVLSKPDATEASELTATPPSQADKGPSCCRRFWGGLGPTLRGVACPWPCLCCLLVHSHTQHAVGACGLAS